MLSHPVCPRRPLPGSDERRNGWRMSGAMVEGTRPGAGADASGVGEAGEQELRRLLAGLTAVRDGDFGIRLPGGTDGLLGEIATVFNGMADQLSLFTSEVTRV